MIILITASITLAALTAMYFISYPNKIMIMSGMAVLLVLLNFSNQLNFHWADSYPHWQNPTASKLAKLSQTLYHPSTTPNPPMTRNQGQILLYLDKRFANKENLLIHFKGLNSQRLKLIFHEFQKEHSAYAGELDYKYGNNRYTADQITKSLRKYVASGTVYFIIDNAKWYQDFIQLQNAYSRNDVSFIFSTMPGNYSLNPISNFVEIYEFDNNYMSEMVHLASPAILESCSRYRQMDFNFLRKVKQGQSINKLCTQFPTNAITECIRKFMNGPSDRVPLSRVQHCLQIQDRKIDYSEPDTLGYKVENGLVKLRKEYYYAGTVDKNQLLQFQRLSGQL